MFVRRWLSAKLLRIDSKFNFSYAFREVDFRRLNGPLFRQSVLGKVFLVQVNLTNSEEYFKFCQGEGSEY